MLFPKLLTANVKNFERWENPVKQRYYIAYINLDLFGDYVVTRIWGKKDQQVGKALHTPFSSYQEAVNMFAAIRKRRLHRGYHSVKI